MTSSRDDQALQDFKDKWGAVRYPFTFYELDVSPAMCKAWALAERLARSKLGVALLRLVGKA